MDDRSVQLILAQLEALAKRLDGLHESHQSFRDQVERRFDAVERRFVEVQEAHESFRAYVEQRFDEVQEAHQSFRDQVERRFDEVQEAHQSFRDQVERRFDELDRKRADDRKVLIETLASIENRLDRLEHLTEEMSIRQNDLRVRHRHLAHRVADIQEDIAVLSAR